MAGNWIKVEYHTPDKPEMLAVANDLGMDPDMVFAAWFRLWRWADANLSRDGHAASVTLALLSRTSGVTGFAESFAKVGWLVAERGGVTFANFDRHNGNSSKQRHLGTLRQEKKRHAASVTLSASASKTVSLSSSEGGVGETKTDHPPFPDDLATDNFRAAWDDWTAYRREAKLRKYVATGIKKQFIRLQEMGHDRAIAAIGHSIAQGWQGIYEPSGRGAGRTSSETAAAQRRADKSAREYPEPDTPLPIIGRPTRRADENG